MASLKGLSMLRLVRHFCYTRGPLDNGLLNLLSFRARAVTLKCSWVQPPSAPVCHKCSRHWESLFWVLYLEYLGCLCGSSFFFPAFRLWKCRGELLVEATFSPPKEWSVEKNNVKWIRISAYKKVRRWSRMGRGRQESGNTWDAGREKS